MTDCPHTYTHHTKFTKANGAVVVRMQCDRCGAGLQERPKLGQNMASLPEFDGEKFKEWQRRENEARREERLTNSQVKDDAWWERYRQYLQTEHWNKISQLVRVRDVWCQVCFGNRCDQAHHISYKSFDRLGYSFTVECVGVCVDCHRQLHEGDPK